MSYDSARCREAVSVDLSGDEQRVTSGCMIPKCDVSSLLCYMETDCPLVF